MSSPQPTTSDMTVSKILDDFGSAVVDVALKLNDDPNYKFEKDHDAVHKQALAAIEAHYAAIRKADMEYVIGFDDDVHMKINNASDEDLIITLGENANNRLRAKQRQRIAERLNNERKTDE